MNFRLLIFSFIYFCFISALAQNSQPVFTYLTIEDGLSQSSVNAILQDKYGFMWFGTEDGLNRFDGYTFKVFRNEPDNPNSLSNNSVPEIFEDSFGSLWIGTREGLNLYDRQSNSFIRYQHNPNDSNSLSGDIVWTIFEDNSRMMWIGTYGNGLNAFDRQNKTFKSYKHDPKNSNSLSGNYVLCIYEDHSGVMWLGTNNGLNRFDPKSNSFIRYQHDPNNPKSLPGSSVISIYEDHIGNFWIGTGGSGLILFNRQNNTFITYQNDLNNTTSLSNNIVYTICEDHTGSLWLGTWGGGLNLFDSKSNSFKRYQHNSEYLGSLMGDFVISIYEDRSGILWVGTVGNGLNLYDKNANSFNKYTHSDQNYNSLSGNNVSSIFEDHFGLLWVGTFGDGLNKFDPKSNSFKHYYNDPENKSSISHDYIHSIREDRSGNLWIGTENGLNLFDRPNDSFIQFKHDPKNPNSISNNTVTCIYEDSSGLLWFGTYRGGLNLFDRGSNSFISYQHNPENENSLSSNLVYCIRDAGSGFLWIGTDNGLNLFNRQQKSFIRYHQNPQDPNSLSNSNIYCIYKDQTGKLWIGTNGGGLNLFDQATGKFKHFREKDGLSNDVVYGILEDESNRLWISTNKGISRIDLRNDEIKKFDVSDGLSSNEFNSNGYFKARDGMMYFGSINGITAFNPASIKDNPFVPPIAITELLLFNKPVEVGIDYEGFMIPQSILTSDEVVLSYRESVFTLEFSALCFVNPEKQKYAYRLEGFDNDWTYTDARRRFATYTNLDPGTYIFHVKGSNHDLVWNEEGRSLKIVITPPWWKTTWAYIGYALGVLGFLYSIRQFEKNRERLKHEAELKHLEAAKLREVDQLKSRFFTNISHEFRTPLTLILGPIQKWREKTNISPELQNRISETPKSLEELQTLTNNREKEINKDLILAERNTQQLLNLVNQLLDLSKIDAGKLILQASKANIVSFVKGITMSFESLADNKNINLQFICAHGELELYFDRDKMTKILINILSNAFKFTDPGGEIVVSLTHSHFAGNGNKESSVVISVKDTGIGISEKEIPKLFDRFYQVDSSHTREHEGTGIGLALTKELVELHHGTIKVKSRVGEGSEFIVELPAGSEHLSADEISEGKEINDAIFDKGKNIHSLTSEEYTIKYAAPNSSSNITRNNKEVYENIEKDIILIVEDNAEVRGYIRDSLGDRYIIEEASNGEQGIEKAKEIIPDLVISDVMMPKMDGKELTRRIKNDEITSHIPVILLTAKSEQESKLEGLETGADDYLTKPFDTKELNVRIKNLISIRKKLQEKFSEENIISRKSVKKLSVLDEKFLNKSLDVVENHLSEEEFSIEEFGNELGMSRQQLNRKIKALTGKTASLYVRSIRLLKAKNMIKEKKGNISEIAYSVGFSSPAYFAACFREEFGYPPSNILT